MSPTVTPPSGEAAQTPASAASKWGLGRETRAALLYKEQARMPQCPECNQSELTWASKPGCGIATTQKALT